ncbi:MAG: 2-C-methyl-D-erythritol 4-phosphate cytidylyltransferase, partial [Polynucleobacter victoriensis]
MNSAQTSQKTTPALHVLMPCAGTGSRMGFQSPKQFESLAGRPMALHALNTFLSMSEIKTIWVGVSPETQELPTDSWPSDARFHLSPTGGATRQETVLNTLRAMSSAGVGA